MNTDNLIERFDEYNGDTVIVCADGLYFKDVVRKDLPDGKYEWVDEITKIDVLFRYVGYVTKFEKGLTLGQLIEALSPFAAEINVLFCPELGGYDFQIYIDDLRNTQNVTGRTDLTHLELSWVAETHENSRNPHFSIYVDFSGVGPATEQDKEYTNKDTVHYGIEFTPLAEMSHVPVIINEDFHINRYCEKDGKFSIEELCTGSKNAMTFRESVGGILNEISFIGTPERRDGERKHLNELGEAIMAGTTPLYELDLSSIEKFEESLENPKPANDAARDLEEGKEK